MTFKISFNVLKSIQYIDSFPLLKESHYGITSRQ
jgi:hypothetical protein